MAYVDEERFVAGPLLEEGVEVWSWCENCSEINYGRYLQNENSPRINELQREAREHGKKPGHTAHFQVKREGVYDTTRYRRED